MAETGTDINKAAKLILEGKLVAIPTETVYGLAANALNETAVLAVFEAKERPFFDPLILHLYGLEQVNEYASLTDIRLVKLAESFWPGPLTLLLPKNKVVPEVVTSGLSQVAIRIPDHALTLELLKKIKVPLAAPSANPFGYVSPTTAQHVLKQLGGKIAYIVDGGPAGVGLESTIIGIEDDAVCVYRLGGLPLEEIEKQIGKVTLRLNTSSNPKAPGQLKNHYSPRKPLLLGNLLELQEKNQNKKTSVISFIENKKMDGRMIFKYVLSPAGDLKEAAINLFKMLRLADEDDSEIVLCETVPEKGLGLAINDRLRRAAAK